MAEMHGMTYLVIPFIFHNADGGINRASVCLQILWSRLANNELPQSF